MDLQRLLKQYTKKTITLSELAKLSETESDAELYALITENKQYLKPILSSKTNGNRKYPIYLKYKILLPQKENAVILAEIRRLHPKLQMNGWLVAHPQAVAGQADYSDHRRQIWTDHCPKRGFFFEYHAFGTRQSLCRKKRID